MNILYNCELVVCSRLPRSKYYNVDNNVVFPVLASTPNIPNVVK